MAAELISWVISVNVISILIALVIWKSNYVPNMLVIIIEGNSHMHRDITAKPFP